MSVISSIVEPVVRQARRLSRLSAGEDTTAGLAESLRNWNPSRLWTASPPASISEIESEIESVEGTEVSLSSSTRQWARSMPSPPPDAMPVDGETRRSELDDAAPARLPPGPNENQTAYSTLNPSQELLERSRLHEADSRPYSSTNPAQAGQTSSEPSARSDFARAFYESDAQARPSDGSASLPADDGMGPMRKKIRAIWEQDGSAESKSHMLQALMTQQYNASRSNARPMTPLSLKENDNPGSPISLDSVTGDNPYYLSDADLIPTYAPADQDEPADSETMPDVQQAMLGCKHYKRNVKLQCFTCNKWYTCRFCHDEDSDHVLPRQQTENMLCMLCRLPQPASSTCKGCSEPASYYFCSVCKLWNNDTSKPIYHCDDCGICRLGRGLGRDFFHCKTCCVCMSMGSESTHRCIERSTKCDCPICGDFLFTSPSQVVFMKCGHSIHQECFNAWCTSSYRCPICAKSIVNMETAFRNLDQQIANQPMPAEYANTRAYVHCNDCFRRGVAPYHWLGLKCEHCESYNTQQHHLLGAEGEVDPSLPGAPLVTATPALPLNVADEAVAIPNPGAAVSASRRVSFSEAGRVRDSTWLDPRARGARSVSPTIGNYFGTGQGGTHGGGRGGGVMPYLRRVLSREEGGAGGRARGGGGSGSEAEESVESSDDDDDNDTDDGDDDDDDNDLNDFELPGHR